MKIKFDKVLEREREDDASLLEVTTNPSTGKDGQFILNVVTGFLYIWFDGTLQLLHELALSNSLLLETGDLMLDETGARNLILE